jgi:PhnB protein
VQINPYLHFNGQCEEAFNFYAQCLGGKIDFMLTYAGTPVEQHVPAEWQSKILHATLAVGDQILQGADGPPETYKEPQGFSVSLNLKDPAQAERIFHTLAENGKVQMPLQKTFWAALFGMLVDQFGIPWMINCAPAA